MELESYNYVVTIERQNKTDMFDSNLYLFVKVNGERLISSFCYTEKGARRKALKVIMRHQKEIKKGTKFGVIFGANGDYEKIVKDLEN